MSYGLFGEKLGISRLVGLAQRAGVLRRAVDKKPIWAQLRITDNCNLSCSYCVEYERNGKHVPFETVKNWVEKCHRLGVKHVDFIGGEPLMHPQLDDMLRLASSLNMESGLTTNGFLLKRRDANRLVELGLKRLQLSVDSMEPNKVTVKAMSLLLPVAKELAKLPVWFRVNTVIVDSTIHETRDLATTLFDLGIPVSFSLGHVNGSLEEGHPPSYLEMVDWLIDQKAQGKPVDVPRYALDYYRNYLTGKPVQWTCEGGSKAFHVGSDGSFRYCTHKDSGQFFEDIERADLEYNHGRAKGCESNCGVQCMVITSLPFSKPSYVMSSMIDSALGRQPGKLKSPDRSIADVAMGPDTA